MRLPYLKYISKLLRELVQFIIFKTAKKFVKNKSDQSWNVLPISGTIWTIKCTVT